jgi:hypothetical protein
MPKVLVTPNKLNQVMLINNRYKINLALSSRTRCVKSLNLLGTVHCFSNLRRVTPFYSLIELCFDYIDSKVKHTIFNIYIKVCSSVHGPMTNRNDLPNNAAKLLISLPLLWCTLSTQMVNAMFSHCVEVTLPVYTWGLLDRYFIRVERENFGSGPGLYGNIISYNKDITFCSYANQLFTEEFLYNCLVGTDFNRLVTMSTSENGEISYTVDTDFRNSLDSMLKAFTHKVYSYEFLLAVSSFYSNYSSKFYTKLVTISKLPDRRINIEAGIHCLRNHETPECYIFHKSVDPKFDNQFFFNSFVILAKAFGLQYYAATNVLLNDIRQYGDGVPGNNELHIDITSVKLEDVFKTLLSAGVRTTVEFDGKREPITPLRSLEVPFGGIRQFSSVANSRMRNLGSNSHVPVGSIYYYSPVISLGYSRVDFGDGRIILINTSLDSP